MKQFNKYQFLTNLQEFLTNECTDIMTYEDSEIIIRDTLIDLTHEYIDRECIYYADCWSICYELASHNFEIEQTGEIAKDITELAYWSLYDLSYQIDLDSLIESVKEKNNN